MAETPVHRNATGQNAAMSLAIAHSSVTSPVFELAKVVEFDIEIIDDSFGIRIELFQAVSDANRFRARLWRDEFFRVQPTFPQDENTGEPAHEPSDEAIFVDSDMWLSGKCNDFRAETAENALQSVLDDFKNFLVHTIGEDDQAVGQFDRV
jgi:hypothetical protein